jgi:acetyltransferase
MLLRRGTERAGGRVNTVASRTPLERLFAPASVAVVGASSSPDKAGHQAVLALDGFGGDVFPVNPRATEVAGRRAFPSLRALGRPVDLVVLAVPASACVEAVREAVACGCGGGLILGGGFAESGPAGAALQAELHALCAQSGFRVLGPNTAGFVNKEVALTASFLPAADRIPSGSVAVVAQSAGINLTVSFLLERVGSGVSMAVGLGNAMNVDASDVLEFAAARPATRSIALHLEGVVQGRRLYETLRRVTRTKPVVVLTVGKSDVGEFAQSHTGNLIGSYALRASALRQAGAVVVDSTEELAAAAALMAEHRLPPQLRAGIGILTAQAGPGLVILDQLKSRGVSVPALAAQTLELIGRALPPTTYLQNPVDTGRPGDSFPRVLELLADDPAIAAVCAYALHEPAALRPEHVLPPVASRLTKPLLFGTAGPRAETHETVAELRRRGLYVAESPEQLARAALVLVEDAAAQARGLRAAPPAPAPAYGDVHVPAEHDEHAVKQLLEALGVPSPRRFVCSSHAEARAAFERLSKPVVAKILAQEIGHKTELGGVQLNIADEQALARALEKLDAIPLTSPRRYLLEEMAPPGLELILGGRRDASFGPTLMVGLGGIFAEALRDTSTRLAPLSLAEASDMLDELRAAPLFAGFRNSPALDGGALTRAMVSVGDFLALHPEVTELEINPLRVYPSGVLALDALLR